MGRCYPHLSLEERRKLAKWREAKMPVPKMADRLGRAPSTIYRELKRNYYHDKELPELNGYHALVLQLRILKISDSILSERMGALGHDCIGLGWVGFRLARGACRHEGLYRPCVQEVRAASVRRSFY